MGFFDKLKQGLGKTKSSIDEKINNVFSVFRKVDEDLLEELEEVVVDNDENEEVETDYDFSALNKLELIEILEETVQDADVVKIKDKVVAIKSNFLRICKEERDKEMEQFILDGGDKENYEHVEDPLEVRFKAAFNIFRDNKLKYNETLEAQKVVNLQQKK